MSTEDAPPPPAVPPSLPPPPPQPINNPARTTEKRCIKIRFRHAPHHTRVSRTDLLIEIRHAGHRSSRSLGGECSWRNACPCDGAAYETGGGGDHGVVRLMSCCFIFMTKPNEKSTTMTCVAGRPAGEKILWGTIRD